MFFAFIVGAYNEIGLACGVHPIQVGPWKKEIQEQASTLFEGKRGPKLATSPPLGLAALAAAG